MVSCHCHLHLLLRHVTWLGIVVLLVMLLEGVVVGTLGLETWIQVSVRFVDTVKAAFYHALVLKKTSSITLESLIMILLLGQ